MYCGSGPRLSSLPAPLSHDLCVCSGATPAPGRPQMLQGHAEELWEQLSLPNSFPLVLIHPSQAWKCPEGGQSQACPRDPQPGMSFALRREGVCPLRSGQGHPRVGGQAFSWWVGKRGAVPGPRIAARAPGAGWALLSLRCLPFEYQQGGSLATDQNLGKQLFLEHWLGPCDSVLFGLCLRIQELGRRLREVEPLTQGHTAPFGGGWTRTWSDRKTVLVATPGQTGGSGSPRWREGALITRLVTIPRSQESGCSETGLWGSGWWSWGFWGCTDQVSVYCRRPHP